MFSWLPNGGKGEESDSIYEPQTREISAHDRILDNLFQAPPEPDTLLPVNPDSNDSLPPPVMLNARNSVYDPWDGALLGSLVAPDHNVQPEDHSKLNDNATKNEELWSHLSTVLDLQTQISQMHLELEEVGANAESKGKGKGTRSRAASVSRVIIDDAEGDEGVGGARDEEAERDKAREEQFSNLASQFRGKKEAMTAIMDRLDALSKSVTEFHALQAPKIDFFSSRENSVPVTNTTVDSQFTDTTSPFDLAKKPSLPLNILKRVDPDSSAFFTESPLSIAGPLPP
ncbi:hypothetical protein R3P38DRAFT_2822394 [Favolaschia claudopus]|uniref:Uncharacterized protein n=1 Tax=Favolaschia claudopus TaxID=2862362 RepID=A0AAW0EEN5_9AGAR